MIWSSLLLLLVTFSPVSGDNDYKSPAITIWRDGTCRCLSQIMCDQPGGCQFKCQPGYAGENCQYVNLGFKSHARGQKVLDGNYNTCIPIRTLQIRRFNTPGNINTVRIHRRKGGTGSGKVYLYVEKKKLETWVLPGFKEISYGDIVTVQFPVVDGVTSATINRLTSACEIEFSNESEKERVECTEDSCSGRGTCSMVDDKASCACEAGFLGPKCDIDFPATEYNTTVGVFNTSRTPVGRTFSTPCHVSDGQPLGEVNCSANEQGGGNWSSFTTNRACDYSDLNVSAISDILIGLLQGNDDIEKVINTTVNISRNMTLNKLDVLLVSDILERTRNLSEVSTQVAAGVLTMYSRVIEAPKSTLTDLEERAASSLRILRSVDDMTGKIQPGPTGTKRLSTETFIIRVWDLASADVINDNLPFGLLFSASDDSQTSGLDSMNNKSADNWQTDEAVLLPHSLLVKLKKGSEGKDIRMSMIIYKDPLLFTIASKTEVLYHLKSKVVSVKIVVNDVEITDLGNESITLIFSQPKVDTDVAKTCGYWNFSMSGWSTDGCKFSEGETGLGECTCDHLTNFAILLDLEGNADRSSIQSLPLSVITTFGLSLSILGLSGTLLSFIMFKKLREKHPQQTLFNLALAELCAWLVFLAGITHTQSHAGCTLVAILLHYFLLASFMWMLAEAFLHYLLLVKVQAQGAFTNRYMLKTGLSAWGIPLLPVLIVLAVDPGLYRGSDSHCWMSLSASLYAFALPVGIIILFNIIIYIKVVINIFRMSKAQTGATKGNKKRELLKIRVPFLCFILFGLSWTFGFLAVAEAKVVFQYLFCLTSSSQGFFIFIFFTASNEKVRQLWSRLCCRKKRKHLMSVGKKEISPSNMTTRTIGDMETLV